MPWALKLVSPQAGPQHGGGARKGEASDWPRLSQVTTIGPISYSQGQRLARCTSVTWHVGHMARLGREGGGWDTVAADRLGGLEDGAPRPPVCGLAIQKMPEDERLRQS